MNRRALVALCLGAAVNAHAYTGNELQKQLDAPPPQSTEAMAYVLGVMAGMTFGMTVATASLRQQPSELMIDAVVGYCIPSSVTVGQMTDVVRKYLASHPESRHEFAPLLMRRAFIQSFPCRR